MKPGDNIPLKNGVCICTVGSTFFSSEFGSVCVKVQRSSWVLLLSVEGVECTDYSSVVDCGVLHCCALTFRTFYKQLHIKAEVKRTLGACVIPDPIYNNPFEEHLNNVYSTEFWF